LGLGFEALASRAQGRARAGAGGGGATPVTTITVTADAQGGADVKPPQPQDPAQPKPVQPPATATPAPQYAPVVDLTGVEKSALYKINPITLWKRCGARKRKNVYDILAPAGQILFSTDGNGRIYRLTPDRKVTLVVQTMSRKRHGCSGEGGPGAGRDGEPRQNLPAR